METTSSISNQDVILDNQKTRILLKRKRGLRIFYEKCYRFFISVKKQAPTGIAFELGSGAGFIKDFDRDIETTDLVDSEGIERVVDALNMPYEKGSVGFICCLNTLHHISDCEKFFREVERVLKPGGKFAIVDQFPGLFSKYIYKYIHHEHYDDQVSNWDFEFTGPMSSANGALAYNIFFRDRELFTSLFPGLRIRSVEIHTPLLYWHSGGLKSWQLPFPEFVTWLDSVLIRCNRRLGSFLDIVIERV